MWAGERSAGTKIELLVIVTTDDFRARAVYTATCGVLGGSSATLPLLGALCRIRRNRARALRHDSKAKCMLGQKQAVRF